MLFEEIDDPGGLAPDGLRKRYESALADAIEGVGVETVVAEVSVDRETVDALVEGSSPGVSMEDAAAVLAAERDASVDAILAEVRDQLLLGMTTAVLDVDTLASELGGDLEPREIQQKIEGRASMTLAEYAELRHAIATANEG